MRRALLMALLLLALPALAEKPFPVPFPKTDEILRMGYVGFDAWAQQQVPNLTDAQRDAVADSYNKVRRTRNDQMAMQLPDTDRVTLRVVTRLLDAWRDARIKKAVSGTPHSIPRERAGTADLIGTCIAQWNGGGATAEPTARPLQDRKEAGLLAQLEHELPNLPAAPHRLIAEYVSHEAAAWH